MSLLEKNVTASVNVCRGSRIVDQCLRVTKNSEERSQLVLRSVSTLFVFFGLGLLIGSHVLYAEVRMTRWSTALDAVGVLFLGFAIVIKLWPTKEQ